jgi:hypothetical protein
MASLTRTIEVTTVREFLAGRSRKKRRHRFLAEAQATAEKATSPSNLTVQRAGQRKEIGKNMVSGVNTTKACLSIIA